MNFYKQNNSMPDKIKLDLLVKEFVTLEKRYNELNKKHQNLEKTLLKTRQIKNKAKRELKNAVKERRKLKTKTRILEGESDRLRELLAAAKIKLKK